MHWIEVGDLSSVQADEPNWLPTFREFFDHRHVGVKLFTLVALKRGCGLTRGVADQGR